MMAESYESSATLFTTIMIENILSVKLFPYFSDRKSILINNTGFIDKNAFLSVENNFYGTQVCLLSSSY